MELATMTGCFGLVVLLAYISLIALLNVNAMIMQKMTRLYGNPGAVYKQRCH
jgi:hypothetical protein